MTMNLKHDDLEALFKPFAEKMSQEGLNPLVVAAFRYYFGRLVDGDTGKISGADIVPLEPGEIADVEKLSGLEQAGRKAFEKTVIIKLNGGLGTSMALSGAKSLLEIEGSLTFLDIIVKRILSLRERLGTRLPLIFMNSFNTEAQTLDALSSYPGLSVENIPLTFLQHKFPKVLQEGLKPAIWPADPALEWNPPGHGDLYTALVTSGMLRILLDRGIRYAFVSNVDNLGGVIDEAILGYFAKNEFPFMMEVADRTPADSKGGHLARLKSGRLTLREIAQCPEDERQAFQNIRVFQYFNTNNIWVNLPALQPLLEANNNLIPLSMIRNPKTLDPRDDTSPPVYQLETAMGSAISVFDNGTAVRVPRNRFLPVKKSQDLLALWSDAYVLTDDYRIILNPKRDLGPPIVELDSRFYKGIDQLQARFSHGAPSLSACRSLTIRGDVAFGRNITIENEVVIANHSDRQVLIPNGTRIEKDMVFE